MPQAVEHRHRFPGFAGEVSASDADGGAMSLTIGAHGLSARFAGTHLSRTPQRGGKE